MDKYLKKFKKLKKPYKLSVIFIGLSTTLLFLLVIFVLFPILNLSVNEATAVSSSEDFDRILVINNILSGMIIVSSIAALTSAIVGKSRDKQKSKK